jgi:hypothetical protein
MARARDLSPGDPERERTDEYHSYVMRVRSPSAASPATAKPTLAIRVEYVNERKAMHFNELSSAFDFIAASVRRNVLHADP